MLSPSLSPSLSLSLSPFFYPSLFVCPFVRSSLVFLSLSPLFPHFYRVSCRDTTRRAAPRRTAPYRIVLLPRSIRAIRRSVATPSKRLFGRIEPRRVSQVRVFLATCALARSPSRVFIYSARTTRSPRRPRMCACVCHRVTITRGVPSISGKRKGREVFVAERAKREKRVSLQSG